jgi:hypothetical protein
VKKKKGKENKAQRERGKGGKREGGKSWSKDESKERKM